MKKILFLLIIILTGGFLLFRFFPKTEKQNVAVTMKSEERYRIPGTSFSFVAPAGWDIVNVETGVVVLGKGAKQNPESAPISIDVSGSLPYEKAVEEISTDLSGISQKPVSVAGLTGFEISGTIKGSLGEEGGTKVRYTMLDNGGRLVSIDLSGVRGELEDVYDEVRDSLAREGST